MNIPIPHIKCKIDAAYLYDGDPAHRGPREAVIVGASAYVGQPITFHFMVEGKYLFSDLPVTAVWESPFTLEEASAFLCKTGDLECFQLDGFKRVSVMIPRKGQQEFSGGEYLLSFDFPKGNQSAHLIRLDRGGMVLAPNYRVNWKGERNLPDYKKNRQVWEW